jgi:hypothetical protein
MSTAMQAQESDALIRILLRKGILTPEEAAEVRAELAASDQAAVNARIAETPAPPPAAPPASKSVSDSIVNVVTGGKKTQAVALYGRLHGQYAYLGTDAAGKESTNHAYLRRVRLGAKAELSESWSVDVNYDFAGRYFDKGLVRYKGTLVDTPIDLYFGLRKVNMVHEEHTSSSKLVALERAGTTRYFVESNNGRRLGAASYRVGVFLDGNSKARKQKTDGVFWGVAITNPERAVKSDDAAFAGTFENNSQALWGDIGYAGHIGDQAFKVGGGFGILPEQGGKISFGSSDLQIYNAYASTDIGPVNLMAEYLAAHVEDGVAVGQDAKPWGILVQSTYDATEKLQLVGRLSYTDSDGRGIKVSDGVRSAPASFTGDNLTEYYLGLNYYLIGNDLKFQAGYVRGWVAKDGVEETSDGLRSQIAINF